MLTLSFFCIRFSTFLYSIRLVLVLSVFCASFKIYILKEGLKQGFAVVRDEATDEGAVKMINGEAFLDQRFKPIKFFFCDSSEEGGFQLTNWIGTLFKKV